MNATILKFPIERTAGYSANLPSLEDMCLVLNRNYAVLGDVDRWFFDIINYANYAILSGENAKIDTIIKCRSVAWTMISRHGLNQAGG